MPRTTTVSALFAAGLFAASALGQPPGGTDPMQPGTGKKQERGQKTKPADPSDATLKAVLASDPDVLVARAKLQLAEAEYAKARQAVVLKVMTLRAAIREHESALAAAQERYAWTEKMMQKGFIKESQLLDERAKLESARIALSKAQTELKLLTGGGTGDVIQGEGSVRPPADADSVARAVEWLMKSRGAGDGTDSDASVRLLADLWSHAEVRFVKGPVPDRIRAALDKSVKLGAKGEKVTFAKAMGVFKEAGLDVPVRYGSHTGSIPDITSEGEELPVGAWFQLFQDARGSGSFYVRDYGLLFAGKDTAPPDAPTLTEFWKQRPPATGERWGKETTPKGN